MRNQFVLIPANGYVWNQREFVQFLIDNQGLAISLTTNNEGVCLESAGIYKLLEQFNYTDVTIHTANWIEHHPKFKILPHEPLKFFKLAHTNYQNLHTWNEKYVFGCFYNRPLWHRIALAAHLQHSHKKQSLINVRANPNEHDQRPLFEIQELFNQVPECMSVVTQVMQSWPSQVESVDSYTVGNSTNGHTDQIANFYTDFLIDIVAETWTLGDAFYPTEKTIRPMLLKKPFIVMGSQNYLEYLRQLGFWTFDHFWDEQYDGYSGRDRYLKIVKLIDDLSKKSQQELYDMYCTMQYVLDHNYDVLTSGKYKKFLKRIND